MPITPINPSSRGGNGRGDKKSTDEKILEIFVTRKHASAANIFSEFEERGWETPKSNVINSSLARMTNGGLLRHWPGGKDEDGNTVWERTALNNPLDDNRVHEDTIKKNLESMKATMADISRLGKDPTFRPTKDFYSLMDDYAKQVQQVLEKINGYQDRTGEAEYKRRVALGL